MSEYQTLKNSLIHFNKLYHGNSTSEVPDEEYDKMFLELKLMEKEQGFADTDSPTQSIGTTVKAIKKVKHQEKMYSLDNVFSAHELNVFFDKYPEEDYCIEPKADGMSIELTYIDGKLMTASTRGDGIIGENITDNALMITNIPKDLYGWDNQEVDLSRVDVRGECIITKDVFRMINERRVEKGLEPYKTARNLVSGTMMGLDPNDVRDRMVKFYAYGTTAWKDKDYLIKRKILKDLSFDYVPTLVMNKIEGLELMCESIKGARDNYEYDIDGAVVKLNSAVLQSTLGHTSKDPRWAVARKWNSEGVITAILDVENQIGRTGVITPVAKIDPIVIGGVTVTSASLHNYEEIKRLGIYKGCKVRVVRSGDVIPKVEGIYFDDTNNAVMAELFAEPTNCPQCNSPVMSVGVKLYCSNRYCFGQRLAQLNYFVSREAMNIIDLSEQTIKQLVLKGFVREYADLYKLTQRNLLTLEGYGDKSADKLLMSIEDSRRPTLAKFIVALGIPNIGIKTANTLANRFHSIENLAQATVLDLLDLNDIGTKTVESITEYFRNEENLSMITNLMVYVTPHYEIGNNIDVLNGKSIVITGSFESTREEIGSVLERYGAKVSGSVSSKTSLLIQGDSPGDGKLKNAVKHNTVILNGSGKSLGEIIDSVFDMLNISKPHLPF